MSTNPSASLKLTQQDHLMSKLSGTGTPDTTQHEWAEAQARDTAALIASSPDLLSYLAAAQGSSVERVRIVSFTPLDPIDPGNRAHSSLFRCGQNSWKRCSSPVVMLRRTRTTTFCFGISCPRSGSWSTTRRTGTGCREDRPRGLDGEVQ